MPVYLRIFYYKKLVEAKQTEQDAYDKASKKGSSAKDIKRPSFSKPPSK
tara:strand:- start:4053 stop:4199 length:147 start_codon:yes stop_codon:yes gene_type:complete